MSLTGRTAGRLGLDHLAKHCSKTSYSQTVGFCSYVEFRNMWSLWPGRPVTLYNRANLPRIFLAAFSIVKGMQSIHGCIGKKGATYAAGFRDLMHAWGVPG